MGHRDTSLLLLGQLPLHGDRVWDTKRGSGTPCLGDSISKCLIAARHAGVLLDLCLEIRWLEKPGPLPFLPFLGGRGPCFLLPLGPSHPRAELGARGLNSHLQSVSKDLKDA